MIHVILQFWWIAAAIFFDLVEWAMDEKDMFPTTAKWIWSDE